jgi:iron complex outermembrane receptor protein
LNYTKGNLSLTATLRRDGSSRFSPETRWGLFPSAAVAYTILDGKEGFLNSVKARIGYGVTGQQAIGEVYAYLPRFVVSQSNAQYQLGNTFYNTLRPSGYDLNIKWEETSTYNAGVDFALLDNRLTGSIDVYQKYTKDLLNFIPVAIGSNLTNYLTTNVGDMQNNGIELSLAATPIKNETLTWEIAGNATYEQNEITRLLATDDPKYQGVFTGGISGGVGNTIQIHSVGHPLSTFFVYQQKYDDNGNPIEGEYVDRNEDGQITPDDRYHYENPAANWFFGINTSVTYKGFQLSASGRAKVGNYIYNNVWSDMAYSNRLYNSTRYLSNAHSALSDINFTNPQYFSDYFVQDASFFRLDHVTLSYDLSNLVKKAKVSATVTVQNPLLITKYQGLDPEVGGIDGNVYPRARTIMFGLNATF